MARKTVAALIAAGQFRAPRATKPKSQPNEPKKRQKREGLDQELEEEQESIRRCLPGVNDTGAKPAASTGLTK